MELRPSEDGELVPDETTSCVFLEFPASLSGVVTRIPCNHELGSSIIAAEFDHQQATTYVFPLLQKLRTW